MKAQISDLHRKWLREAGAEVSDGVAVEISPWYALDAEELRSKVDPGMRITAPTYFS